jgi:hypothetical protein
MPGSSRSNAAGRHANVSPASKDELKRFLREFPRIDWQTGLHLHGEELLVKARNSADLRRESLVESPTAQLQGPEQRQPANERGPGRRLRRHRHPDLHALILVENPTKPASERARSKLSLSGASGL